MAVATKASRRFDVTLLYSVDDLIADSAAANATAKVEASPAPYQSDADAQLKHEARMDACHKACWKLANWAHTYSKTCPIPARDACFRILDRWYVLCGQQPLIVLNRGNR